ncbi:hypothetical protein BC629DRAFT_1601700 [Irpex lacteus]|nr:hypothetical protein BC629DRAFT_1601700 [Irpex lacteus]
MATSSVNDAVIKKLHLLDIKEDLLLQALQLIRKQRTVVLKSLNRVSTTEARPVTIHSLPPKLLTKIFEAACLATIDFGFDDEEYSDLMGVPNIVLSQVCHTWRQLAVQTSSLWTRLDLSSPQLVTDCDIITPHSFRYYLKDIPAVGISVMVFSDRVGG